jgi:predicted porin
MGNKRTIYLATLLSIMPTILLADENIIKDSSIKISGDIDPKYGIVNQSKDFRNDLNSPTNKYKQNSLATSGSLKFNYDQKTESGLGYGGYIKLNTNTSKTASGSESIANELKIYLEGNFGKFEVGSTSPVGSSIEVNSYSLARATGGLDGDLTFWLKNGGVLANDKAINGNYITAPQLPVGFDETTKAGKINYFTPNVNGFTFGLSYVPASKAKGTVNQTRGVLDNSQGGYKNIWQPAVGYEKSFSNGVKFTTAIFGEFGKAKKVSYFNSIADADTKKQKNQDRNNLKAWQVGAGIGYQGFAFNGAYGDIGKSGTLVDGNEKNKKGGKYWSLGSAYAADKYGISIKYMQSKRAGALAKYTSKGSDLLVKFNQEKYNKFEAISIGVDYTVMPGFMPYVKVTRFNFKKNDNFGDDAKFNKGTVVLAGTKIKF